MQIIQLVKNLAKEAIAEKTRTEITSEEQECMSDQTFV